MKLKELVKIWVDTGVLTDDKFMIKGVELTTIKDDLLALEDFQGIERLYILENRGYDLDIYNDPIGISPTYHNRPQDIIPVVIQEFRSRGSVVKVNYNNELPKVIDLHAIELSSVKTDIDSNTYYRTITLWISVRNMETMRSKSANLELGKVIFNKQ